MDDYHKYDREERRGVPFTVLNPECNYIDIMEQHLQLLALGRPILKPVYDHTTGRLGRPVPVEPRDFVIVEGLLPLHTKLSRACFDITVFLDPPEAIRREWKLRRDCKDRGYSPDQVLAELERREPEARRPTSGRSGSGRTSRSGSLPSPATAARLTLRCRPRSCSGRRSCIPTCRTC